MKILSTILSVVIIAVLVYVIVVNTIAIVKKIKDKKQQNNKIEKKGE